MGAGGFDADAEGWKGKCRRTKGMRLNWVQDSNLSRAELPSASGMAQATRDNRQQTFQTSRGAKQRPQGRVGETDGR